MANNTTLNRVQVAKHHKGVPGAQAQADYVVVLHKTLYGEKISRSRAVENALTLLIARLEGELEDEAT